MQRPGRTIGEFAVVVAAAFALAIAWTWPLVLHLDRVGRASIDGPFEAWVVDWVQHAVRSQPAHLYDANIFAPTKGTLGFSSPLVGVALPLLPLRWLGLSPYGVYNAGIIVAIAASCASAYLLGRMILRDRAASAVVAVAFAFGRFPYEKTQLQITARAGIPLAAAAAWWLCDRADEGGRWRLPAAALVAVVAWQTSVSLYPASYAAVAMVLVLIARWRVVRAHPRVLVAAALAVVAMLVVAIPHLAVAHAYPEADRQVPGEYGINLLGGAFPGVALLIAAVAGAVVAAKNRVVAFAALLVGAGLVMGVGTAAHGWRRYAPYRLAWDLVPGIGSLRDFSRAWLLGILGLGVFAGLAVGALRTRMPRAGAAVAMVVAAAIFAEGFHFWNNDTVMAIRPVDRALAAERDAGGVLYLPLGSPLRAEDGLTFFQQPEIVYRTTAHHRKTVNAYFAFFPAWSGESTDLAHGLPCSFAQFWQRGIRFVVVDRNVPASWAPLHDPKRAAPLRLLGNYDGDLLYAIPDPAHAGCAR